MDAEKDKPHVEKSPSFDSKTTMDDDSEKDKPLLEKSPTDITDTKTEPEKDNVNDNENDKGRDLPDDDDNGVKNPSSPKSPSDAADPNSENALDSEIKEEKEKEEEEEEKPALPPDLHKIVEEIDQFIAQLIDDTTGPPDLPISVEQFVVLMEAKIEDYDSVDTPVKWGQLSAEDSSSFLENVNRVSSLSKTLSKFSSDYKYAYSINRVGGVLQRLMSYVEEEFKSLLEDYKIQDSDPSNNKNGDTKPPKQSPPNQESDQNPPPESDAADQEHNIISGYSDEILSDLIRLSDAMIAGGYETECFQAYLVARRNALEERLHQLGFQKHSMDEVHKMQWESLEREIESWIKIFKQVATVYFPNERKLSDSVFSNHSPFSETLFGSLAYNVTIQLLNFAEAVGLTKRAQEKLFKFIDTYEALRDTVPEMDALFAEEWLVELKTEASIIRSRLGEAMILIFNELENSIRGDSAKNQVPGGAVHPLTKYTMNYLEFASSYRTTLEQVFREHQKIERADSATGSEYDYTSQAQNVSSGSEAVKQSPFQAQIIKVMDLMDANVEARSKLYKDPSLSSIFMMNNGRYILKKIRGSSELNALMGDTWYRKKSSDLRQYHKGYQRETWGKLLSCLTQEGLTVNGKVMKPVLKERFKSFNAMFDEIHKTQSNWVVGDEQLQSELRVSISNMVIPAYRSFLGRYAQTFTPGRQTEKYVKYQAEDIETYIDELFDGTATPMGRKKP